jgi:hypothetical protein
MLQRLLLRLVLLLGCAAPRVLSYAWSSLDWGWPELKMPNVTADSFKLPPQKRTIISFVNGIYHNEEDWQRITQQLDEVFKQEVRFIAFIRTLACFLNACKLIRTSL